ncbi:shikimate dehydrogenase [Cellulosimicrobium sp. CUA-896]|uniref:shikimate dehydrogenase family protein n=1 Tax=Cellulosimicrobium sp. CUA-896 TaxID=1517881 RepID=UPI0009699C69|nr:shikimate dehydrogenase [Cellulosimicrobium sp. CUA-896]OLT53029.1 shikimate dehydrogenase [Cellulosimicrobium sp. CUA-896]
MSVASSPRRAAVLGHPVAHSLSPVLHRAAYAALGLDDWRYEVIDTTEDQLPAFVASLDASWAGLSLTMPLKHAVIPLLDHVEPLAEAVGAVNTLVVQPVGSGRPTLVGANTDVYGLVTALREGLDARGARAARQAGLAPDMASFDGSAGRVKASSGPVSSGSSSSASVPSPVAAGADVRSRPGADVRSAVVIGGGATAASTLAALAELGCPSPTVLVRSLGRTGELQRAAHRMGVEPRYEVLDVDAPRLVETLAAADVVVSTLPAHAADPVAAALARAAAMPEGVLLDVAYDPRPSALSLAWTAGGGGEAVGGERMLLHQAVEQVRLMTGRPGPVATMDDALATALVGA